MICPFMSNAQMQSFCRLDCGLSINGECAIRKIAQDISKLKSEINQSDGKCVNSVENSDSVGNR